MASCNGSTPTMPSPLTLSVHPLTGVKGYFLVGIFSLSWIFVGLDEKIENISQRCWHMFARQQRRCKKLLGYVDYVVKESFPIVGHHRQLDVEVLDRHPHSVMSQLRAVPKATFAFYPEDKPTTFVHLHVDVAEAVPSPKLSSGFV